MTGSDVPQLLRQLYAELLNKAGELNYLKPLFTLRENKTSLRNLYDLYIQVLAEYASYVRHRRWEASFRFPQNQQEPPSPFSLREALPIILRQVASRQVVMINEAHTKPQHRLFAESLLAPLYQAGFRILAIEALSWGDLLINQRKYPLGISGTYTKEPYFANLIRKALALGFSLVSYEQKTLAPSIQERERQQAEHLAHHLKENPATKLLVFAGHLHIAKTEDKTTGAKTMATLFREITGIDPFVIEQTILQSRRGIPGVSVFWDKDAPWLPEKFRTTYDLMLVYPLNPFSGLHKALGKKKTTISWNSQIARRVKNKLLQVFRYHEYRAEENRAIPVEQKILLAQVSKTTLYLAPGADYFICIKDTDNSVLASQKIDEWLAGKELLVELEIHVS